MVLINSFEIILKTNRYYSLGQIFKKLIFCQRFELVKFIAIFKNKSRMKIKICVHIFKEFPHFTELIYLKLWKNFLENLFYNTKGLNFECLKFFSRIISLKWIEWWYTFPHSNLISSCVGKILFARRNPRKMHFPDSMTRKIFCDNNIGHHPCVKKPFVSLIIKKIK